MSRWLTTERVAPIVAGISGLGWFWMELAPQRAGFQDTDNPAVGLAFIAAHPEAWPLAGGALGIAAVALVATALAMRVRLATAHDAHSRDGDEPGVGAETLTVVGLVAAAMLFGMAALRMSGGPVRYVQGLDQSWGETAYLVTQFIGIQALVTGGFVLLELWVVGAAWLGVRRGVIPRVVAAIAVVPASRLLSVLGPLGIQVDVLWPLVMLSIPATFAWLVVLGATVRTPDRMTTDDILADSSATRRDRGGHLGEASA